MGEERRVYRGEHLFLVVQQVERGRSAAGHWGPADNQLEFRGPEVPEALWSQLNRVSMDAPPNAIKASRGEAYGY